MKSRIVLILIGLTCLWLMMLGRAGYLQLVPDRRLVSLQKRQFETVITLHPRRGDVLDRNGHELAVSMPTYSLFVDPKIIEEPRKVTRYLAHELKLPLHQIEEKMRSHKKRFVWIQRGIEKNLYDSINEQKIRGLGFIEESRRIYPNERLLSHVLGFVGGDGKGLEGLELRYNESLEATQRKVSFHRDARGRPLIVNGQVFNQVPDGSDVVLTIDRELQFILEQELAQTVVKHQADAAVGIVLDAQTSEVLAMASSPAFDPNKPDHYQPDARRNRAVTDSFEPGSTMKTFVLAGAIQDGTVDPSTRIGLDGGVLHIGKRVIREADTKHKFKNLTVTDVLARSSNVGMSKIAFKMGPEAVRRALTKFGFGDRTGIDLPGEVRGIIQPFPWHEHLLANISFGHGLTATPLQIVNAYAAIANGGWLKKPYIVKEIRDHENSETIVTKTKNISRVLTDDQVTKMRQMLLAVTAPEGTGYNARIPGYPVAGKTGTAQKVNPFGRGYLKGGYISSFAGFVPAANPKFVIYIAVDRPRKEYYGAAVAAPVFSRVGSFALRRAGIAPVADSEPAPRLASNAAPSSATPGANPGAALNAATEIQPDAVAPDLESPVIGTGDNGSGASAAAVASGSINGVLNVGSGKIPTDAPAALPIGQRSGALPLAKTEDAKLDAQSASPLPSAPLQEASLDPETELAIALDPQPVMGATVPDLNGLSLREVLARVSGTGIDVQVHGHGFVTRSIPASGSALAGGKLTVFLGEQD